MRVDTGDYSVDPRVIGRFVDVAAPPSEVTVRCGGEVVASHARSWAKRVVVTDPAHVEIAELLRREHAARRDAETRLSRRHGDGHAVMLRALPDYDALFGVDADAFTPTAAAPANNGHKAAERSPTARPREIRARGWCRRARCRLRVEEPTGWEQALVHGLLPRVVELAEYERRSTSPRLR